MALRSLANRHDTSSSLQLEDYNVDLDRDSLAPTSPALPEEEGLIESDWERTKETCLSVLSSSTLEFFRRRATSRSKAHHTCPECGMETRRAFGWRMAVILGPFVLLGVFQLVALLQGIVAAIWPAIGHPVITDWSQLGKDGSDLDPWPKDFTRNVKPVPCHSHNDYTRAVPLYSALSAGCISVEADVWLVDGELYVGHYERNLQPNRTLSSLYLNPLLEMLDYQNAASVGLSATNNRTKGVFSTDANQVLTLLIDFKNNPKETWTAVSKALEPLRSKGYLSYWDGDAVAPRPIIVVGTGDTPFEYVTSESMNPRKDIFFDAPLETMLAEPDATSENARSDAKPTNTYSPQNSYYASVSFGKSIGRLWSFDLTAKQLRTLRGQIKGAHEKGLKVRYWELPDWPISLRNKVWGILIREGVDILNVDDLKAATSTIW